MHADLIITGTHVFTGLDDEAKPLSICVKDGKIQAVVAPGDAQRFIGPDTRTEDFKDAFVCAGLHDAHLHAFHSALYSSPLAENFLGENEADCVARLEQRAKRRPNGWLLAQGW